MKLYWVKIKVNSSTLIQHMYAMSIFAIVDRLHKSYKPLNTLPEIEIVSCVKIAQSED